MSTETADIVNHPPHYTMHASGVECIEITEYMSFNIGNAFKHVWRSGLKKNTVEDLKKAAWYITREIDRKRGMILQGIVVETYTPDVLNDRMREVLKHEVGSRGAILTALFLYHQNASSYRQLSAAALHLDDLINTAGE